MSLWEVMDRFRLDKFIEAYQLVAALNQTAMNLQDIDRSANLAISRAQYFDLKDKLAVLTELLTEHGLTLSAMSSQATLDQTIATEGNILGQPQLQDKMVISAADLIPWKASVRDLQTRVRDEFKSRYVLVIPADKVQFYNPHKPLFGPVVDTQFPSQASFEISEAGKCFALGRYTATVFHLMRILEIALESIRLCLQMPKPIKAADKNWGRTLENMNREIKGRSDAKPQIWTRLTDKTLFDELYITLDRIRGLWRNTTMHVETKYTEEEAKDIFDAVKTLMRKIASRFDEKGIPFA
jgi:hypothetical protein